MKIGIIPVNVGGPEVRSAAEIACLAEEVGVESVWTYEHVIVPLEYESRYPYHRSGKMPVTPETHFVDPLVALAFIAGQTTTIRLGTGINILPQANPLLLAKQVASLDFLSGGRFILGAGAGWLEEEYAAMGTPFRRRGARFDDYLEAIRKVWTGEEVEHRSEFLEWSGFKSLPAPAARSHPPILIGGTSKAAFRRVARHGDGWFAPNAGPKHLQRMLRRLHGTCAESGRDPDSVEVTAMWLFEREGVEAIERYEELGVKRLVVPLHSFGSDGWRLGLERLGACCG